MIISNIDFIENIDETTFIENYRASSPEDCKQIFHKSTSQITFLSQNIRSVRKNFDYFLIFLKRLDFLPDVIVLSECWIDETFCPINLPNYNCHFSKHYLNQNDGIIIFSKSDLDVEITEPVFHDANCLIIKIANQVSVIALYRSPSISNTSKFLQSLENVIDGISGHSSLIIGDLNIDIKPDTTDPKASEYLDLTAHYGFLPGHVLPTRGPNCLDHALIKTSKPAQVIVCVSDITDHDTVLVGLGEPFHKKTLSQTKFKYKIDYDNAIKFLEQLDWSQIYLETDVSNATSFLVDQISLSLDKNSKKIKVPSAKAISKPWMNVGLINCIRKRDRLHQDMRKNPKNLTKAETYKTYRNKCNVILEKRRNEYESHCVESSRGNSKLLWSTVKNICNIQTTKNNSCDLLSTNCSPLESLNHTNNFFTTVGKNLADDILCNLNSTESELADKVSISHSPLESLFLTPTDADEIGKILSGLKSGSASGYDHINNEILKYGRHILSAPLAHLCNLSMSTGTVPSSLKVAEVCPIHKSGNKTNVSNYRPISLLPAVSKILEKVVNKRLLCFLENNDVLSPNQYGFRTKKSTEDAVVALVDNVVENLDQGKKCIGVFLDLAKAFDTVSWPILLRKLELVGVRGVTLSWFHSYLSERKQRVRISNQTSDYLSVNFGVPQGSVLGPTLFLIYINDLCQLKLNQSKLFAFADDTALIFQGNTWDEVIDVSQDGLSQVSSWLQNNLLTLNISKTKYLTFRISDRTKMTPRNLVLHYCGNTVPYCSCPKIEQASKIKYLGTIIDDQLSWSYQINAICGRVRKLMFIFKKLKAVADSATIRTIYIGLCQSILNYCIISWGSAAKTLLIKVERAQRAVLKVAYKKPFRYPTSLLYEETKYLTVRQLYILATTLRFHRTAKQTLCEPLRSTRRNVWNIPSRKTTFAQRSFYNNGAYLYRLLDKKLKILLLSRYQCRNTITCFLQTQGYDETEKIMIRLV